MTTPERLKRRQMVEGALLVIIGIIMIIQQTVQSNKDEEQDRATEVAVNQNAALTKCLAEVVQVLTESNSIRSDAAQARDDAELAKEAAMSVVIRGRVTQGINRNNEILQAAREWQNQYMRWVKESNDLNAARDANPPPEFSDFCPRVAPEKTEKSKK